MPERRQAFRREPIEIELSSGEVWLAKPLPWLQRNDLGNEILAQNAQGVNDAVDTFIEDKNGLQLPRIRLQLMEKVTNWSPVLHLAFPEKELPEFEPLTRDDAAALVLASLEVNGLEHLNNLVDPNSPAPTLLGGALLSQATGQTPTGQKIESTPDSSSVESPEMPLNPSPSRKSSRSRKPSSTTSGTTAVGAQP